MLDAIIPAPVCVQSAYPGNRAEVSVREGSCAVAPRLVRARSLFRSRK
jgi:hypothetical protein